MRQSDSHPYNYDLVKFIRFEQKLKTEEAMPFSRIEDSNRAHIHLGLIKNR